MSPKSLAISQILDIKDMDEARKIVASLKICLLADDGANDGLNSASRKRAWQLVHDLAIMLDDHKAKP